MTQKQIADAFQAELGRAPTGAEISYFMQMGQGVGGMGQMSPYEAQQSLMATPEAQERTLGRYAGLYGQQLGQSDAYMMGQAGNQLQGQFRRMGRGSSTGYISAFAQAAQNLAMNRQTQMAQFYGQGLGGVMQNRAQTGQTAMENIYGQQQGQIQFGRDQDLANRNYARQMDYANTQRRQGMQSGLINAGIGLAGTIAGGAIWGGLGAAVGGAGAGMIGRYKSGELQGNYGQY